MEITNEDNMQLMSRYKDNYFDLAIVDPPYGKKPSRNKDGLGVAKRNFESGCDDWDIKPNKEYWQELFRISKNQIIWGGNYFIENLSMLTESGMDVLASLQAIKEDVRSSGMKMIIDTMIIDIESGSTLWRALERTKLAQDQVIALVRVGEESGRLSENLSVVALQQEKDRAFKSKIRSAMMYPVLVLIITS